MEYRRKVVEMVSKSEYIRGEGLAINKTYAGNS
jgi:hypothetical protein